MDAEKNNDQVEQTHYEQVDPNYPTEEEIIDGQTRRLGEALHRIDDLERRIARNAGHDRP